MTQEDAAYIRDLQRLVEKVERISPPRLQHIEGPGFVMIDKQPAPTPRNFRHLILGAAGGLLSSSIVAVAFIFWLINT